MAVLSARSLALVSALLAASVDSVAAACPANARGAIPRAVLLAQGVHLARDDRRELRFDADMKAKVNLGHQAVIDFIGGVEPVTAFLFEPNGAASAYADMETPMCTFWPAGTAGSPNSSIAEWRGVLPRRRRGDVLPLAEAVASVGCITSRARPTPPPHRRARRAENTHAVQGKYGDMFPAWLMEGGAVRVECLLAHKMPSPRGVRAVHEDRRRPRRGHPEHARILRERVRSEQRPRGGEDMCCNELCGTGDAGDVASGGVSNSGHLFYDSGAVAIAWAINKAGKTSKQFWTSKTSGVGFWGAIVPYDGYDYAAGFPSSCPADAGWKKASPRSPPREHRGVYAEFDAWAKTASESDPRDPRVRRRRRGADDDGFRRRGGGPLAEGNSGGGGGGAAETPAEEEEEAVSGAGDESAAARGEPSPRSSRPRR